MWSGWGGELGFFCLYCCHFIKGLLNFVPILLDPPSESSWAVVWEG